MQEEKKREGKERKGKERRGKERKGRERKGDEMYCRGERKRNNLEVVEGTEDWKKEEKRSTVQYTKLQYCTALHCTALHCTALHDYNAAAELILASRFKCNQRV